MHVYVSTEVLPNYVPIIISGWREIHETNGLKEANVMENTVTATPELTTQVEESRFLTTRLSHFVDVHAYYMIV